jgi:excisionase family DNA binding protein
MRRTVPTLLCAPEVAELLNVSVRTVQRLAAEGRLERRRLGYRTTRYTAASVAALIDPDNGGPA